jgi:predicted NAD/FAD-binding protein
MCRLVLSIVRCHLIVIVTGSLMHIGVIGGGAAGMATAHYLAKTHQVTVFERRPVLGGNIRTLNRNIVSKVLPDDLYLDNGVIEFHQDNSPALHELIAELGLELSWFRGGSTSLYLPNQRSFHMPGAIRDQQRDWFTRLGQYGKLGLALRHLLPIGFRMLGPGSHLHKTAADFLSDDEMSRWMRMLLMYGYSIPYQQINEFPAKLAYSTLQQGAMGTNWVRLKGGVYRYIEAIVNQAGPNLTTRTNQKNLSVARAPGSIEITSSNDILHVDRVVFATPPDQVLTLLTDPTEAERRRFVSWQANRVETLIHTDTSIYADWPLHGYTEFDLFEKSDGKDAGYNAYLNRLCDVPVDRGRYFLAFNLEDRISADRILDRQQHHTPLYTAAAIESVDEIKACNGQLDTYYAGAFLYNGLHEGAIQSAQAIRDLLGD